MKELALDIRKSVMGILGNPPYSGHSANNGEWIKNLLKGKDILTEQQTSSYFKVDGKPLDEKNPKWLNDDYVKFIRFAQWQIEKTGYGSLHLSPITVISTILLFAGCVKV